MGECGVAALVLHRSPRNRRMCRYDRAVINASLFTDEGRRATRAMQEGAQSLFPHRVCVVQEARALAAHGVPCSCQYEPWYLPPMFCRSVEGDWSACITWPSGASRQDSLGRASAAAWKQGTHSYRRSSMVTREAKCCDPYDAEGYASCSGQFSPRAVENMCAVHAQTCPSRWCPKGEGTPPRHRLWQHTT